MLTCVITSSWAHLKFKWYNIMMFVMLPSKEFARLLKILVISFVRLCCSYYCRWNWKYARKVRSRNLCFKGVSVSRFDYYAALYCRFIPLIPPLSSMCINVVTVSTAYISIQRETQPKKSPLWRHHSLTLSTSLSIQIFFY